MLLPTIALDLEAPDGVVLVRYSVDEPVPQELTGCCGGCRPRGWTGRRARRRVQPPGRDHLGPVAEHTPALVLAAVRRLHLLVGAQRAHRWTAGLGGLQPADPGSLRPLAGARVLVWGFGSIAASPAPHLRLLGVEVTGVAHPAGERGLPSWRTSGRPCREPTC